MLAIAAVFPSSVNRLLPEPIKVERAKLMKLVLAPDGIPSRSQKVFLVERAKNYHSGPTSGWLVILTWARKTRAAEGRLGSQPARSNSRI
jgi:hypothetical protein